MFCFGAHTSYLAVNTFYRATGFSCLEFTFKQVKSTRYDPYVQLNAGACRAWDASFSVKACPATEQHDQLCLLLHLLGSADERGSLLIIYILSSKRRGQAGPQLAAMALHLGSVQQPSPPGGSGHWTSGIVHVPSSLHCFHGTRLISDCRDSSERKYTCSFCPFLNGKRLHSRYGKTKRSALVILSVLYC